MLMILLHSWSVIMSSKQVYMVRSQEGNYISGKRQGMKKVIESLSSRDKLDSPAENYNIGWR